MTADHILLCWRESGPGFDPVEDAAMPRGCGGNRAGQNSHFCDACHLWTTLACRVLNDTTRRDEAAAVAVTFDTVTDEQDV